MAKCKVCKSKMVLMQGNVTLEADSEPYESGEEIDLNLTIDKIVCAHYCEKCDRLQQVWED